MVEVEQKIWLRPTLKEENEKLKASALESYFLCCAFLGGFFWPTWDAIFELSGLPGAPGSSRRSSRETREAPGGSRSVLLSFLCLIDFSGELFLHCSFEAFFAAAL